MIMLAKLFLVVLLVLLLFMPLIRFLCSGWKIRRHEIIDKFGKSAIESYYGQFFSIESYDEKNYLKEFENLLDSKSGRVSFIFPSLMLTAITFAIVLSISETVFDRLGGDVSPVIALPAMAISAFSGAYMWVLYDFISRARRLDFAAVHVSWACFRLVIAAPLGYAVAAVLADEIGVSAAFLFGAFPTHTMMRILRRQANRHLEFGDTSGDEMNELEKLQGINTTIAERFGDEGINTILQLAYCDPVDLTTRSGFSFNYVVDCVSQALAWIYLEDKLVIMRQHSLRGAQEISTIVDELDGKHPKDIAARKVNQTEIFAETARKALPLLADDLQMDPIVLERMLREIAGDPYTQFICDVWE